MKGIEFRQKYSMMYLELYKKTKKIHFTKIEWSLD